MPNRSYRLSMTFKCCIFQLLVLLHAAIIKAFFLSTDSKPQALQSLMEASLPKLKATMASNMWYVQQTLFNKPQQMNVNLHASVKQQTRLQTPRAQVDID